MKRSELNYDESEILKTEEKLGYADKSFFRTKVVNSSFAFIHVAWSSIASGFRAIYKISKSDIIDISESDFDNPSSIVDTALNSHGLVVHFIIFIYYK